VNRTLRQELNELAHDHLAAVIAAFCVIMSAAAGFYFSTQVQLISEVGANTERSENNQYTINGMDDTLRHMAEDVSEIRVDVAVIKERQEAEKK